MPLLLIIIFIVVPIAELAVLIQVGQLIGVWWTIALLVADAILGSWLLRTQTRTAWRRFNEALAGGRVPHREVIDGVLVIFGGVLLLTPGFITDIFGLLFLFPPTRVLLRGAAGSPRRAEADGLDARHRDAAQRPLPPPRRRRGHRRSTSIPTGWTRRDERGVAGGAAPPPQAGGHGRRHVLVGRHVNGAVRARAGRVRPLRG